MKPNHLASSQRTIVPSLRMDAVGESVAAADLIRAVEHVCVRPEAASVISQRSERSGISLPHLATVRDDCFAGRIQPVNATHSLNISAGVWKPSVLRGLSFNCLAIALSWVWEKSERSMPFGMY